jgi:HSP20 family protein
MSNLRLFDPLATDPFDDLFKGFFRPVRWEGALQGPPQIKIDVSEKPEGFVVKAEVPGVKKEDIDIRIDGDTVTISAEVKQERDEKKEGKVVRSERYYGAMRRSMSFGTDIDESKAQAKCENGVLEVFLPKKEKAQTKRLAIQ